MRVLRLIVAAFAAMCASVPVAASAATIIVTQTSMQSPNIVRLNDGVVNMDVYLSPVNFTAVGFDPTVDLFCIDPHGAITIGAQVPPLVYTSTTLQDFLPSMSVAELENLADIIRFATQDVPSPSMQQNAAQAGIWNLQSPGSVTSTNPSLQAMIDTYDGWAGTTPLNQIIVWQSQDGHQTFAQHVPEPAAWAMMIVGFGLVGGTLRRATTRRSRNELFA